MSLKNIFLDIIRLNSDAIKGSYIFNQMRKMMKERDLKDANNEKETEKITITVNKNGFDKEVLIDLDENQNVQNLLMKMSRKNKC